MYLRKGPYAHIQSFNVKDMQPYDHTNMREHFSSIAYSHMKLYLIKVGKLDACVYKTLLEIRLHSE